MAIQAPILNSILQPALYSEDSIELKIEYHLSRGMSNASAQNYTPNFLFKTIPLNTTLYVETEVLEEKVGEYIVLKLINEKFTPGESYKVQMQFKGEEEGYWSTPATFKVAVKPYIEIRHNNIVSSNSYTGIFQASILDNSESLQYSQFILKDQYNNTIEESDKIIHNSLSDGVTTQTQYNNNDYSSIIQTETYTFISDLKNLLTYQIIWKVTTNSGLVLETEPIEFIQIEEIEPDNILRIEAVADNDNGVINGYLYLWDKTKKCDINPIPSVFGDYIILRSSSKDNFSSWIELERMNLNSLHLDSINNKHSRQFFQDFTVESNTSYRYGLQQCKGEYSSKKIKSKVVHINYEHLYLFDEERQLNLLYNTKISSFKNNILEAKQDTIGGKYPYIFRNGNVMYKDFAINSLLSYQSDPQNLFNLNNTQIIKRPYNSLLSYDNILSEKIYREEVQNWLNNGKPKYLKSGTEGIFKIYTMNVTLQPNDTLGRMLYTVSFTAYEIGEIDKIIVKFPNKQISSTNEIICSKPLDYIEGNNYFYHTNDYSDNCIKVKNLIFSEISEISKVKIWGENDVETEFIVGPAGLKIDELEFSYIEIYHPALPKTEEEIQNIKIPWISYIVEETIDFADNNNQNISNINNLTLSNDLYLSTIDLESVDNKYINENNEVKAHEVLANIVLNSEDYQGTNQATYSTFIQLQFIPKSTSWKEIDQENKTIESKSYVKFKESIIDEDYQILQIKHALVLEDIQLDELILGPNIQAHCVYRGVFYDINEE